MTDLNVFFRDTEGDTVDGKLHKCLVAFKGPTPLRNTSTGVFTYFGCLDPFSGLSGHWYTVTERD